jgi:hypothetical protein
MQSPQVEALFPTTASLLFYKQAAYQQLLMKRVNA